MSQCVLQPMRQRVQAGEVQGTAEDRKCGQANQRQGHHRRILGRVLRGLRTRLPEEDHQDLASHVEGREEGGGCQEPVDQWVDVAGVGQNFILGPEAGQGWNPRQGQRADEIHPERDLHSGAQSTHVAHILRIEGWALGFLAMLHVVMTMLNALDHRSRRQEEQGLEECMRHQVEHPGHVGPQPNRGDHESKLADRRVRQHTLDVELRHRDARREQRRCRANDGNQVRRERRQFEKHMIAGDHVNAGGDHGGSVNQRRNRSRSGHGVRKPDMQRELGGFPGCANQ